MESRIAVCAVAITAALATPSRAYQPMPVADGGTIKGVVRYVGTPPLPTTIRVTKDPDVCGREKTVGNLLVASDGGLRNAVVRLVDIPRGKPLPDPATVTVRQKDCEYTPRVLLFPAGSRVRIVNDDGILHNTNATSEVNRPFSIAQPRLGQVAEKHIEKPEMPIRVRCDVHSWMGAWWVAEEHPYYAVSDEHGAFVLDDVPPGDYTLEAWHESLGKITRTVTVTPRGTIAVTLEMTKR
jgi:hypothetical protein